MKFLNVVGLLIITFTIQAQHLIINPDLISHNVEEVILPVSNNAYVLVKDSTAYVYNIDAVLPFKKGNIKENFILDINNNRLLTIALVPEYFDKADENMNIVTLVSYKYEINYSVVDSIKANNLVDKYDYFIPKSVVHETIENRETLNSEDLFVTSIYSSSGNLALPSHYLRIDKNQSLSVLNNGYLTLSEVKNNKVVKDKSWGFFNGSISLQRSIKIGDFARINFQRYKEDSDILENFWCIIDLKKQIFAPIDLKQFYSNLENIEAQDISLINSTPFFFRSLNDNNVRMYVLPDNNYVWLDDQSYYYSSGDLSNYAQIKVRDKSLSPNVNVHHYKHPDNILKAIAPHEPEKN